METELGSLPKQQVNVPIRCKSFAKVNPLIDISRNIFPEISNPKRRKSKGIRKNQSRQCLDLLSDEVEFQPRKRTLEQSSQTENNADCQSKKSTPRKRGKPALKLQYHKIDDFFKKIRKDEEPTVLENNQRSSSPPPSVPAEIIELSSSSESEEVHMPIKMYPTDLNKRKIKLPPNYPEYKIIEDTTFAVDAFRTGPIQGITKYFLTHFHRDHYVGLTKSFDMPLYVSKITGRLVKGFLKVNAKYIRTMDINTLYTIDDVKVMAIDANHCPGAVMFVFKFKNGRSILHTGDFRATPEMESNPIFWNNTFYSIYLDTTYLHRSYNFDTQSEALGRVEDEVRKFKKKNPNFLIVVGTYLIGKERMWSHIAQSFNMKVWLEVERRKALDLIYSDENTNSRIMNYLCDNPEEAQLHILPLQYINYSYLTDYLKSYKNHTLLAFRPTGWEKNSKPRNGHVSIVGVQYSEHSSYGELERFVRFVQPQKVISTVPKSSNNNRITTNIPRKWLLNSTRDGVQQFVTNYMKVTKSIPETTLDLKISRSSSDTDFMP